MEMVCLDVIGRDGWDRVGRYITPPRNKKCGSDPSGDVKILATKTLQNSHWGVTKVLSKIQ